MSRRRYGIDVREIGSGNIGATNVTRAFGWWAGALVFLLDFTKGFAPVYFFSSYFGQTDGWRVCLGIGLVVGHCYSPYLRFRGGKGVATSLGVVSAVIPLAAIVAALTYVVFLALSKISAVGSLAGVAALISFLFVVPQPFEWNVLVLSICGVVITRHRSNISRLIRSIRERKNDHAKK